jgi:hypothetical protein
MLISFLLLMLLAKENQAALSPRELLATSQALFDQGHYDKALQILKNINIKRDFDSSEEIMNALKIQAISLTQLKDINAAQQIIREIFFIDPNYVFDPFDTPKRVVELAEVEAKNIKEKNQQLKNITIMPVAEKAKSSFLARNFLPLGFNFYDYSKTKSIVYFSLQTTSLIANISAFWWKQRYLESFGSSRLIDNKYKNNFNRLQITQYLSLSLFLATFTVSIIDAIINIKEV